MRGPVKAVERRRIRRNKEIQVTDSVKFTKSLRLSLVTIKECKRKTETTIMEGTRKRRRPSKRRRDEVKEDLI
jgi:hypothetical protein